MKKNKKKYIIVLLIVFLSIGYAFLTSNLDIIGLSNIKQNTWNVHFANIVDDSSLSTTNIPAVISKDQKSINFEVTLTSPGEEYYFYVDVVNEGTLDAMLELYEITGLSQEQKDYILMNVTYSDGVELKKHDKLKENSKDTLKVSVKIIEDINIESLPTEDVSLNLNFKAVYVQADKSANERTTIEDKIAPKVSFTPKSSIIGKNNWYKALTVLFKVIDPSGINSVDYCVTNENSCEPNENAPITNNTYSVKLNNSKTQQTICVKGIDTKDNEAITCSKDKYLVDGESPTITKVEVTPDDDNLQIKITGTDDYSGVYKYHYSKDGGKNYIVSNNSNYTFTEVSSGDYVVVTYIEDKAGNESLTSTNKTSVKQKSLCEKNNINDLGDCIIALNQNDSDVASAKNKIKEKGNPNFNVTSPTYRYKILEGTPSTYRTSKISGYVGTGYTFDEKLGRYKLTDFENKDFSSIDFNATPELYMCVDSALKENCTAIYKLTSIKSVIVDGINYYEFETEKYLKTTVVSYELNESGMYSMQDDFGNSYYYRGSVSSNYVKFGDYYWRIVRVNGDGSIRLIYHGTELGKSTGAFKSRFSDQYWDPTFVGYMNNESGFSKTLLEYQNNSVSSKLYANRLYYYSSNYTYNKEENMFYLDQSPEHLISGTLSDNKENLNTGNYYSCFETAAETGCHALLHITKYTASNSSIGTLLSYGSTSYESAITNSDPSTIKIKLDDWYVKNLMNKTNSKGEKLGTKIKDQTFCNDRTLSSENGGDGYSLNNHIHYGAYQRLVDNANAVPRLTCPSKNDQFSISESIGNGMLDYPIGLLSADEATLAGLVMNLSNSLSYLIDNLSGGYVLTMTPSNYHKTRGEDYMYSYASTTGILSAPWETNERVVKPVINIDPTKITFTGSGTIDDPFVIE